MIAIIMAMVKISNGPPFVIIFPTSTYPHAR